MSIKETLQADLTEAIRGRNEIVSGTIRMVLTAITNEEVSGKEARTLTDAEIITVLSREAKKRREAAEAFADAGRADKAALEKAIIAVDQRKEGVQFDALQSNINPNEKKRLVLKTQESVHVVELDDIIRCEADRNYTSFFLIGNRKILVSKTLKEYETLLSGHNFLRVQQSHLVNIDYVDRYDKKNGGAVVMKDGSEVPLSPAKREAFFNKLENI